MERLSIVFLVLLFAFPSAAQDARRLISDVLKSQANVKTMSYTLERTDTLLTGDVRQMRGRARLQADTSDRLFGFQFWSRRDDVGSQVVYTGRVAYETDDSRRTYVLLTNPGQITDLLNHVGGHVVAPDLMRIDTSRAESFSVRQDDKYHYLTIHYADLIEYDVTKRSKTLSIDRTTMLPMAVRKHQESLGKVQDLFYRVDSLTVNEATDHYPFSEPDFLGQYSQQLPERRATRKAEALVGRAAPGFELYDLDGNVFSSDSLAGRVALLDFWEVWCGPCVASMPKVQQLYKKYRDKGLTVLGFTHEEKSREVAKLLIDRKGVSFPTLIGNASVREFYGLQAIPLYVVVDRQGKIAFISEGFSAEIEEEIRKALND